LSSYSGKKPVKSYLKVYSNGTLEKFDKVSRPYPFFIVFSFKKPKVLTDIMKDDCLFIYPVTLLSAQDTFYGTLQA